MKSVLEAKYDAQVRENRQLKETMDRIAGENSLLKSRLRELESEKLRNGYILMVEICDYLDQSPMNTIASTSRLHKQLREILGRSNEEPVAYTLVRVEGIGEFKVRQIDGKPVIDAKVIEEIKRRMINED